MKKNDWLMLLDYFNVQFFLELVDLTNVNENMD